MIGGDRFVGDAGRVHSRRVQNLRILGNLSANRREWGRESGRLTVVVAQKHVAVVGVRSDDRDGAQIFFERQKVFVVFQISFVGILYYLK